MKSLVLGGAVAERFIGSVVEEHKSQSPRGPHPPHVVITDNTTSYSPPGRNEGVGLNSYIIIVAVLGTVIPLICLILTIALARKIWMKMRGEDFEGKVEREDTAQTSLKSRDGGSRKSSRASRVTKDPNSRDNLIPQLHLTHCDPQNLQRLAILDDSMITSPSEGPVTEEIGGSVEEIVVGEPDGDQSPSELTSKVSVSMKNHSLVVEVEGAPDLPDTPTITENGKTHHFTEAEIEPVVPKITGDLLKTTHLPVSNELGVNSLLQKGVITVYLKRSKSERVRPRNTSQDEGVGDMDSFEQDVSPRPHQRRLSMGHHPQSRHTTPQRLTVEPENGNFGISTSDLSLDSNSSCNPSYKYGNQVSYAGGYYGYPVSQGYPASDRQSRRMHLVVPRGSSGGEESLGVQREKVDRKTSLPNALDSQGGSGEFKTSLSPSRSMSSSRGALSKQYSLPASARNARYTPRHRHSFRHDRPHQYQHHDHQAYDHPHVRSHSASLHAPHEHRQHVSRELHSPRLESPHMPRELHSPRLESPHMSRELHSPRVEKVVTPVIVDEPSDVVT
ncbi:uncharacterized protein LOC135215250 isoform X11 [Macrobrachium nipponense]|uniref:uncharacterized protein LOC135215250 isoform X11 n=1 Tax=Macrobrachium nipponense TaxID=159736 RepID=UPI0030C7E46D